MYIYAYLCIYVQIYAYIHIKYMITYASYLFGQSSSHQPEAVLQDGTPSFPSFHMAIISIARERI